MAATEQDVFNLRTDEGFVQRCMVQVAVAATDILKELDTTPFYAYRIPWARRAVADPRPVVEEMLWAIVGNSAVYTKADAPATITVNELRTAVTDAVNGLVRPLTT